MFTVNSHKYVKALRIHTNYDEIEEVLIDMLDDMIHLFGKNAKSYPGGNKLLRYLKDCQTKWDKVCKDDWIQVPDDKDFAISEKAFSEAFWVFSIASSPEPSYTIAVLTASYEKLKWEIPND